MSTDTKIKTLIFNKLTQKQYNNADRVPTEFYLTPDTSIDSSEKGAANGVATLDVNGKVPTEQIPVATTSTIGGVKPDGTTITVTEDGTISVSVSGEEVATKADLQDRVAKSGDTMTGNLNLNAGLIFGNNRDTAARIELPGVVEGTFYQIANNASESESYLQIYDNSSKGLVLIKAQGSIPCYFDGTQAYRLLTTADLETLQTQINSLNTEVTGMLGRMNFNARVDFNLNHGQTYTVPSKGYLWIESITDTGDGGYVYINGGILATASNKGSLGQANFRVFVPVSAGDVLSASRANTSSTVTVIGFFVPQI